MTRKLTLWARIFVRLLGPKKLLWIALIAFLVAASALGLADPLPLGGDDKEPDPDPWPVP